MNLLSFEGLEFEIRMAVDGIWNFFQIRVEFQGEQDRWNIHWFRIAHESENFANQFLLQDDSFIFLNNGFPKLIKLVETGVYDISR